MIYCRQPRPSDPDQFDEGWYDGFGIGMYTGLVVSSLMMSLIRFLTSP